MEGAHNCVVTEFGEEVETEAILNTTRTSSPLGSVALGNIGLDQAAHLSLLVEPHLTMFARINDAGDVWNCDSSFRNVGRFCQRSVHLKNHSDRHRTYHNLMNAPSRNIKDGILAFGRDRGVKRVDNELVLGSESPMLGQHVVHTADFAHSRHENEDRG